MYNPNLSFNRRTKQNKIWFGRFFLLACIASMKETIPQSRNDCTNTEISTDQQIDYPKLVDYSFLYVSY